MSSKELDMAFTFDMIREKLKSSSLTIDLPLVKDAPVLQPTNSSLTLEMSSFGNITEYSDHLGYNQTSVNSELHQQMKNLSQIENLIASGKDFIMMLYSYRSVSRAIVEIEIDIPTNKLSNAEKRERQVKQSEINRKVIDILRPEIMKLNDLLSFIVKTVGTFQESLSDMMSLYQVDADRNTIITRAPTSSTTSKQNSSLNTGDGESKSNGNSNNNNTPVTNATTAFMLKVIQSESIFGYLAKLLDVLIIIDHLFYAKLVSLRNDFERYERALASQINAQEALEEQELLRQFLKNTNMKQKKHYIFQFLCEELNRSTAVMPDACPPSYIFKNMMLYVTEQIENGCYTTPEEKFSYLRILPHLILMIDFCDGEMSNNTESFFDNDVTNSKELESVRNVFNEYPIVPLFGDLTIRLVYILQRSTNFDLMEHGEQWGSQILEETSRKYRLQENWDDIRDNFIEFTNEFSLFLNTLSSIDVDKDFIVINRVDNENIVSNNHMGSTAGNNKGDGNNNNEMTVNNKRVVANAAYQLVQKGMRYNRDWICLLYQSFAWKYLHPCPMNKVQAMGIALDTEGLEYMRVTRCNLKPQDISVLVDIISMIKQLSLKLTSAETLLAPLIRYHIHHQIQQLVQGDLLPLIHRVDKRKHMQILGPLLHVRILAADWMNGIPPHENYKTYSRKQGQVVVDHPTRVVGASNTQLFLVRSHIRSLISDEISNSLNRGYGILKNVSDMEPQDIVNFKTFLDDSFSYPMMLNFSHISREMSTLGWLWYREFYLEKAQCIQFPIEMSIPWILIEHVVLNKSQDTSLMNNLLYMMDIYNDAANLSLFSLSQQYLYNEIEAEADLVLDRVIHFFSKDMYYYYKDTVASALLDKKFKNKLEELNILFNKSFAEVPLDIPTITRRHFEIMLKQRSVEFLGRYVDFNFLISRQLNDKIRKDLNTALVRFQSTDICSIHELFMILSVLVSVHGELVKYADIDPFEDILAECNESFAFTVFSKNKINSHIVYSLTQDIFPNFSYNYYTKRFIRPPALSEQLVYGNPPRKRMVEQLFGPTCAKAYDRCGRLQKGFFGRVHLECIVFLGRNYIDLSSIYEACETFITERMAVLVQYLACLFEHVPDIPVSELRNKKHTVEIYTYVYGQLKHLLDFRDMKPIVFQNFRAIGNCIAFLKDLTDLLHVGKQFEFMTLSPFLGYVPDMDVLSSNDGDVIDNVPSQTPLMKALKRLSTVVGNNPGMVGDSNVVSSRLYDQFLATLPATAKQLSNIISASLNTEHLFKLILRKFKKEVNKISLFKDGWSSDMMGSDLQQGSLDDSNAAQNSGDNKHVRGMVSKGFGFSHIWSALTFLFYEHIDEDSEFVYDDEEGEEEEGLVIENEVLFGHGFIIAGATILSALEQENSFAMYDLSERILRTHYLEKVNMAVKLAQMDNIKKVESNLRIIDDDDVSIDEDIPDKISLFLDNAVAGRQLQNEMFMVLDATDSVDVIAQDQAVDNNESRPFLSVFHPPKE
jgi:cytoplasmic FMR1 interacting protein